MGFFSPMYDFMYSCSAKAQLWENAEWKAMGHVFVKEFHLGKEFDYSKYSESTAIMRTAPTPAVFFTISRLIGGTARVFQCGKS